ncbi:MAG: hypothetical protein R2713_13815 [Ilumatobacteraceae bacterium]
MFVASTDGVRIVDVAEARVIDTLDLPDGTHQLLLDGTRLLVTTTTWSGVEDTVVSLYDVANRRARCCCAAATSRATWSPPARSTVWPGWCSPPPRCEPFAVHDPDQFGQDEDTALAENRRIHRRGVRSSSGSPRWFDENGDGSFGPMTASLDCSSVSAPRTFAGLGISWITTIDLQAGTAPAGSAGVVSTKRPGVRLAAEHPRRSRGTGSTVGSTSSVPTPPCRTTSSRRPDPPVRRLGADESASWWPRAGIGRLLNQFSMGKCGRPANASTIEHSWTQATATASESVVSVLRPANGELQTIGEAMRAASVSPSRSTPCGSWARRRTW